MKAPLRAGRPVALRSAFDGGEISPTKGSSGSVQTIGRLDQVEGRRATLLDNYNKYLVPLDPKRSFKVRQPMKVSVMCLGGMGGSGNVARTAAHGLAEAGHDVHMLSSADGFYTDERMDSVKLEEVGVPKTPMEPNAKWVAPLTQQVIDHVLKNDIEVLDVHYAAGLLEAAIGAKEALAKQGRSLKVMATLHGSDVSVWGKNPKHSAAISAQLKACDEVSAVSFVLAQQAVDTFGLEASPSVIENSIDAYRFHPAQWSDLRSRLAPNDEVVFCHVSNMRPIKRPMDAVDTFAKVVKAGIPAKLLLVGDGPMMEDMYERAVWHGVADHIYAAGAQPLDKLPKYLAASDIALVTSESESFCLAALEAMACGTPVVGTHCGGLDEIMGTVDAGVDRVSRLLAPVGDSDQLAKICIDLATDPNRYERVQAQCVEAPILQYPTSRQVQGYLVRLEGMRSPGRASIEHSDQPRRPVKTDGHSPLNLQISQFRDKIKKPEDES